eukprot:CAMPEP_0117052714 /NCGR_PEP_ID=MMETSP0472-20121206/36443_1 /TAXON_ID=693140 ORGANISM="Tiarina fusus, Strain LIS" /NCGR_SAMPLE_ID=MMETSP0472 /ASSEMBLY_ACC=CAM_ASM_000603 /LENGTH=58 /DNA_ID=CAMNT_0004767457 /DNA_START=216 /DNA_END=392 /DNA_ORIENTATION=-
MVATTSNAPTTAATASRAAIPPTTPSLNKTKQSPGMLELYSDWQPALCSPSDGEPFYS